MDKSSLSWASVFDLQTQTGLHGTQYSWLSSVGQVHLLATCPSDAHPLCQVLLATYLPASLFLRANRLPW